MEITSIEDNGQRLVYTPLPDNGTYLRLLEVQKADDGKVVCCKISTWSIEVAPEYNAISYTWRDPSDTTTISLNRMHVTVRGNCEYALRQAFWQVGSSYVWLDALCINQDDVDEKSKQVHQMGDIFENAVLVLACVGPDADDSEFLMQYLTRHRRLFDVPSAFERTQRRMLRHARPISAPAGLKLREFFWKMRTPLSSFSRIQNAFIPFLGRPYFSRVWVLQEVFLSKRIIIYCGVNYGSFEHL